MVLPQLTPDTGANQVLGAPPRRFRPLGPISHVRLLPGPVFQSLGLTEAQKAGLKFEGRVQVFLKNMLGSGYRVQPQLSFDSGRHTRRLFPDGLLVDDVNHATIIEIKSQHMSEAWWQLRKLYEPVVAKLSFVTTVSVMEIVKSYDPSMGFPEEIQLFTDWREAFSTRSPIFRVLKWKL